MTSEASKPSWFYWLTGGIVIFLLTLLDQGSKLLAVTYLKNKDDIILLPGVLQLKYLENRGMAFGMFEGKIPWFLYPVFCISGSIYLCIQTDSKNFLLSAADCHLAVYGIRRGGKLYRQSFSRICSRFCLFFPY